MKTARKASEFVHPLGLVLNLKNLLLKLRSREEGFAGSVVSTVFSIQLLLDGCYLFHINPLPHLRKLLPEGKWAYHSIGSDATNAEISESIKSANIVWACGEEGLVTFELDKSVYPFTLMVVPAEFPEEELWGSPLHAMRGRCIKRINFVFKKAHELGFFFERFGFDSEEVRRLKKEAASKKS